MIPLSSSHATPTWCKVTANHQNGSSRGASQANSCSLLLSRTSTVSLGGDPIGRVAILYAAAQFLKLYFPSHPYSSHAPSAMILTSSSAQSSGFARKHHESALHKGFDAGSCPAHSLHQVLPSASQLKQYLGGTY